MDIISSMADQLIFDVNLTGHSIEDKEIFCLQILNFLSNEDQRRISSFYFTKDALKKLKNSRPSIQFPSFFCCFCYTMPPDEQEVKFHKYFLKLKDEFLVENQIHQLFQKLEYPLIEDPFGLLEKISVHMNIEKNFDCYIKNPLNNFAKRNFIILSGHRLYELRLLTDGIGGFAKVYQYGTDEEEEDGEYCVKFYNIQQFKPDDDLELKKNLGIFERRVQVVQQSINDYSVILSKLSHPNIIEYCQMFVQKEKKATEIKNICILMRFCNQGNLKQFIENHPNLEEEKIIGFFKQVLNAFKYLQSKNPPIKHGDLKPENILVNEEKGEIILKLADFGCSQKIFEGSRPTYQCPIRSLNYCAPQLIFGQNYSDKCDIWSLGVLLYFMLYKKSPWGLDCDNRISLEMRFSLDRPDLCFNGREISKEFLKTAIREMLIVPEKTRITWEKLFNIFGIESYRKPIKIPRSCPSNRVKFPLTNMGTASANNKANFNKSRILTSQIQRKSLISTVLQNIAERAESNSGGEESVVIDEENKSYDISMIKENNMFESNFGHDSVVIERIAVDKDLKRSKKFAQFIDNIVEGLEKYYGSHTCALRFLLKKWKYVIFLPILKKTQEKKIRLDIMKCLELNIEEDVNLEAIKEFPMEMKLLLMSDNLPENNEGLIEVVSIKIIDLLEMIKIDVNKGENLEQTPIILKKKLSLYQDIMMLLNSKVFFTIKEDYNYPFDIPKLEEWRNFLDWKSLKKRLKFKKGL